MPESIAAESVNSETPVPTDVNTSDGDVTPDENVEMVQYNKFDMPKAVYLDIKKSAEKTLERKLRDQGVFKTPEDIENLRKLKELESAPVEQPEPQVSDDLTADVKLTPAQKEYVLKMKETAVKEAVKLAASKFEEREKLKDAELQKAIQERAEMDKRHNMDRIQRELTSALGKANVHSDFLDTLVENWSKLWGVDENNSLIIKDDIDKTRYNIEIETDKQYNPLPYTIEHFVKNNLKDTMKVTSNKAGAGASYDGTPNPNSDPMEAAILKQQEKIITGATKNAEQPQVRQRF